MSRLPTHCPMCGQAKITYSVGVIRNRLGSQFGEYPVVWCESCGDAYFTHMPFTGWDSCVVNKRVIAFTANPDAIDCNRKLEYTYKLIGNQTIYSVYPASQDAPAA